MRFAIIVVCAKSLFVFTLHSGELKSAIQALMQKKGNISIKYTAFNFQCKYPTRLKDSSLAVAK